MLTEQDKKTLLTVARERIESTLEERPGVYPAPTEALERPSGAFVTLHTVTGRRQLRGCIGQIESEEPVFEVVKSVAYSAAFSDYRFEPVKPSEWPTIELEISVLSPLREIVSTDEIEVGRDGLLMRHGSRSGLLLPQVASERSWDVKTFLEQTCRKAGLRLDAYLDPATTILAFTATVFDETGAGL